jgi:hypothetical protein
MAAQQIVGLWAERWPRAGIAYLDHSIADGKIMMCSLRRKTHNWHVMIGNFEVLFNKEIDHETT